MNATLVLEKFQEMMEGKTNFQSVLYFASSHLVPASSDAEKEKKEDRASQHAPEHGLELIPMEPINPDEKKSKKKGEKMVLLKLTKAGHNFLNIIAYKLLFNQYLPRMALKRSFCTNFVSCL